MAQLFFALEGEARKDDGMTRAWDHANTNWKAAALAVVQHLASTHTSFTTDAVWEELDALGFATHEHRAMGAVMRQAAQQNWVVKTDRVQPTLRPSANRRPVAVWQSLALRSTHAAPF